MPADGGVKVNCQDIEKHTHPPSVAKLDAKFIVMGWAKELIENLLIFIQLLVLKFDLF